MTLTEFNTNYVYKSDHDKFGTRLDIWEVIQPDDNGTYLGDCESYCLSLQSYVENMSNVDLYYCKINGNGHCIMIKDNYVLDCNCRMWIHIDNYTKAYNMTDLRKYSKVEIVYKKIIRKLYKLFTGK